MNITSMPSLSTKRSKMGIGSFLMTFLFGAVFLGAGILIFRSSKIDPSWTRTIGHVSSYNLSTGSSSNTYSPVVSFNVAGQTHKVVQGTSSSSIPSIGSERKVAYDPANPDAAKVVEGTGTKLLFGIFPAVGLVIMAYAPIALFFSVRRSRRIKNLVQTGIKVQGVVADVRQAGQNGSDSKVIVSAPDQSGVVQNYVSDSITNAFGINLADFRNHPIPVDVYIDPTNPANYYVDISDLPSLTPSAIADLIKNAATGQVGMTQQTFGVNSLVGTAQAPMGSLIQPAGPSAPSQPSMPAQPTYVTNPMPPAVTVPQPSSVSREPNSQPRLD